MNDNVELNIAEKEINSWLDEASLWWGRPVRVQSQVKRIDLSEALLRTASGTTSDASSSSPDLISFEDDESSNAASDSDYLTESPLGSLDSLEPFDKNLDELIDSQEIEDLTKKICATASIWPEFSKPLASPFEAFMQEEQNGDEDIYGLRSLARLAGSSKEPMNFFELIGKALGKNWVHVHGSIAVDVDLSSCQVFGDLLEPNWEELVETIERFSF